MDRNLQYQMMSLMQQMIALQQDNNQLRMNMNSQSNFVKKPDRPTVGVNCSDNDWMRFLDDWGRYKSMANLTSIQAIRNELRSTCSTEINRLLFDFYGPDMLNSTSEEVLISYIKF